MGIAPAKLALFALLLSAARAAMFQPTASRTSLLRRETAADEHPELSAGEGAFAMLAAESFEDVDDGSGRQVASGQEVDETRTKSASGKQGKKGKQGAPGQQIADTVTKSGKGKQGKQGAPGQQIADTVTKSGKQGKQGAPATSNSDKSGKSGKAGQAGKAGKIGGQSVKATAEADAGVVVPGGADDGMDQNNVDVPGGAEEGTDQSSVDVPGGEEEGTDQNSVDVPGGVEEGTDQNSANVGGGADDDMAQDNVDVPAGAEEGMDQNSVDVPGGVEEGTDQNAGVVPGGTDEGMDQTDAVAPEGEEGGTGQASDPSEVPVGNVESMGGEATAATANESSKDVKDATVDNDTDSDLLAGSGEIMVDEDPAKSQTYLTVFTSADCGGPQAKLEFLEFGRKLDLSSCCHEGNIDGHPASLHVCDEGDEHLKLAVFKSGSGCGQAGDSATHIALATAEQLATHTCASAQDAMYGLTLEGTYALSTESYCPC